MTATNNNDENATEIKAAETKTDSGNDNKVKHFLE